MSMQQFRKPLMIGGIGAVGAAGFLAVMMVLLGGFNDFTVKALVTTLVIGYYSLTTVATFGEGKTFAFLGSLGVAVAGFGLVITLPEIWVKSGWFLFGSSEAKLRLILETLAVAFGLGYASINLRMSGPSPAGVGTMVGANVCVAIVTIMMVYLISQDGRGMGEGFIRVMIALTITALTLSIISAFVGKMARSAAQ